VRLCTAAVARELSTSIINQIASFRHDPENRRPPTGVLTRIDGLTQATRGKPSWPRLLTNVAPKSPHYVRARYNVRPSTVRLWKTRVIFATHKEHLHSEAVVPLRFSCF
jgi:hypothetical protein